MNEKEFLESFCILAIESGYLGSTLILTDLFIDSFLEEHHKEYFEVEFVKKTEEESDMYIKKITPIEFTAEQAKTMLEKYLEQRKKFK